MSDRPISDEELLAFLLKAIPEDEIAALQERIDVDPVLSERVSAMTEILKKFELGSENFEPSGDLVERTMERISAAPVSKVRLHANDRSLASAISIEVASGQQASVLDMLVSMTVAAIFLALLAPGVLGFRESARQLQCSENLRSIGASLLAFANGKPRRQFPCPEINGPLAFAGVYAVSLADAGLVEKPANFVCPSISSYPWIRSVPTVKEILNLPPDQLSFMQNVIGGTYAYNLGNVHNGRLTSPEARGRHSFAILGDAPLQRGNREVWVLHRGQLVNLVFEDGHVAVVRIDSDFALPDHPYLNRLGVREAGVDLDDSSLGLSAQPPFKWSQQR